MELVKVRKADKLFNSIGWLSVLCGIVILTFLNLSFLTNFFHDFGMLYELSIMINLISGIVALCHRESRSLGVWGISVGLFAIFFVASIFILGWMVYPFP